MQVLKIGTLGIVRLSQLSLSQLSLSRLSLADVDAGDAGADVGAGDVGVDSLVPSMHQRVIQCYSTQCIYTLGGRWPRRISNRCKDGDADVMAIIPRHSAGDIISPLGLHTQTPCPQSPPKACGCGGILGIA